MSEEALNWFGFLGAITCLVAMWLYSEHKTRIDLRERERIAEECIQRQRKELSEKARQAELLKQKQDALERLVAKRKLIRAKFYSVRKKRQDAKQKAIEERKRQEEEQRLAEIAERKRILEAEHLEAKKREEEERMMAALKLKQEEEKKAELIRIQNKKFLEEHAEFRKRLEYLRAQLVCLEQITEICNVFCPFYLQSQPIKFSKQSLQSLIEGSIFEHEELGNPFASLAYIFSGSEFRKNRYSLSISRHVDYLLHLESDRPKSVFAISKEMTERGFPVNWQEHLYVLDREFKFILSEIKLPVICDVFRPSEALPFDLSLPDLKQQQYVQYWGKQDKYFDEDQQAMQDCISRFPNAWTNFSASLSSVEVKNKQAIELMESVLGTIETGHLKEYFNEAYQSNANPLITLNSVEIIQDSTLQLSANFVIKNQSDSVLIKKHATKASDGIPGISKATKGTSAITFSKQETRDFVADSYRSLALRQLFLGALLAKDTQVQVIEIALQTDWNDYATGKPVKGEVVHVAGRIDKILNINPQKIEARACFRFFGGRITADVLRPTRLRKGGKSSISEFPMQRICDVLGKPNSIGIELEEIPYDDGMAAYVCLASKLGKCLFHQLSTNRTVSKSEILALIAHGSAVEADNLFMIADELPSAMALELIETNEIYFIDLSVGE